MREPRDAPPPEGAITLEDLYRREVGGVYRYCLVRLRLPQDAEDATEQTFVQALAAWSRVSGRAAEDLVPWLYRIAVNVVRDFRRSARRRPIEPIPPDHPDPRPGPDAAATLGMEAQELWSAVGRLPPALRTAVALRFAGGLRAAAIGEAVGKTPGAVRSDLWRAMRLLRAILAQDKEGAP